jgi:type 1 glutamine amidotransferase
MAINSYMKNSSIIACLFLFVSTVFAQKETGKIKVLIIDGFSNHDWKQTTQITQSILEKTGLFAVSVSTMPLPVGDKSWQDWFPDLSAYDAIIQNTNNISDTTVRWPPAMEKQLASYVRTGGGLYILHSGNNAFPHWRQYDTIIGLGWRKAYAGDALEIDDNNKITRIPSGEGKSTFHGKRTDLLVNKFIDHPINHGFPKQWKVADTELYQYARGPAQQLTVLSYASDTATQIKWPFEWVVKYGKGRVYNSSMGHLWKGDTYPNGYRCIAFQTTLIRAVQWVATGKVTYPVPANFPTSEAISLKND